MTNDFITFPFLRNGIALENKDAPVCGLTVLSCGSMRFRWNEENVLRQTKLTEISQLFDGKTFVPVELNHTKIVYDVKNSDDTKGFVGDGIITLKEYKNNKKHIKMVISNRDFEGLDLELKKSDNQLFSICESLDEEVENINLISFVKYASEKGRFEFTATSIVKDAKLLLTPKSMGRLINSNLALLEKEGLHITQKRTAKERLYECCYVEPSDEEELDSSSEEND